jgi:hypothetical protein
LSGNGREQNDIYKRRILRSETRDATLVPERLHGAKQTPFAASMGDLLAKYPLSSPPTIVFQGNERDRLFGFRDEEFLRLHHLEIFKLSFVSP